MSSQSRHFLQTKAQPEDERSRSGTSPLHRSTFPRYFMPIRSLCGRQSTAHFARPGFPSIICQAKMVTGPSFIKQKRNLRHFLALNY